MLIVTALGIAVLGLIILMYGADKFIQSSIHIAHYYRISPLIIGMTIVAFGTSAPEAAVSWISSYYGQSGIAIGNVVGSNLFNILVVLGLTSIILPLSVNSKMLRFEVPFLIVASGLTYFFLNDLKFSYIEGSIFLVLFFVFNFAQFYSAKKEKKQTIANDDYSSSKDISLIKEALMFVLGAALLIGGSRIFVFGAEDIAKSLGVSDLIIGLTVVAFGTSLPELAASISAAKKRQADMAIGNVVGSNIYNIFLVLGGNVFFSEGMTIEPLFLQQDLLIFVVSAVLLLPILRIGLKMQKWEGAAFLLFYLLYLGLLISRSININGINFWNLIIYYMSLLFIMILVSFILHIRKSR